MFTLVNLIFMRTKKGLSPRRRFTPLNFYDVTTIAEQRYKPQGAIPQGREEDNRLKRVRLSDMLSEESTNDTRQKPVFPSQG